MVQRRLIVVATIPSTPPSEDAFQMIPRNVAFFLLETTTANARLTLITCVPPSVRCHTLVASRVVGGRTFSDELPRYIIAGYKNPRVFRGLTSANGSHFGDPAHRKAFYPSQVQAAAVLSKCIPCHPSESLPSDFSIMQSVYDAIPPGAQICKTFLSSICSPSLCGNI